MCFLISPTISPVSVEKMRTILLGPPRATSVCVALMSAASTASSSSPILAIRLPVFTSNSTTQPEWPPRPPASQQHAAVAAEAEDVGNAFRERQHAQQLGRVGVVERDLLLPGDRDERRPGAGGHGRRLARLGRIQHRLLEQAFGHGDGPSGLPAPTARRPSSAFFLIVDLRAGVLRRALLDPLADQVELGLRPACPASAASWALRGG